MSCEVVGYTFKADMYCEGCIIPTVCAQYPSVIRQNFPLVKNEEGEEEYDLRNENESTEETLAKLAVLIGIDDREDEKTFDSDEFPKVIFDDNACLHGEHDVCGGCLEDIQGHSKCADNCGALVYDHEFTCESCREEERMAEERDNAIAEATAILEQLLEQETEERDEEAGTVRKLCPSCSILYINGLRCHEIGCEHRRKIERAKVNLADLQEGK